MNDNVWLKSLQSISRTLSFISQTPLLRIHTLVQDDSSVHHLLPLMALTLLSHCFNTFVHLILSVQYCFDQLL